jgi:hypothetical protein
LPVRSAFRPSIPSSRRARTLNPALRASATGPSCRGARKRGWITTSTSAAELSVSANANNQSRTLAFRWRTSEDDERDAEAAGIERLREEGKTVEHEAGLVGSNKD